MAMHKSVWVANDGFEFPTESMADRHDAIITKRDEVVRYLAAKDEILSGGDMNLFFLFDRISADNKLRGLLLETLQLEEEQNIAICQHDHSGIIKP
jgi:hypothetical protein